MPAMTQIPEHYKTEFGTNWEFLVQQEMSKLKDRVTIEKVNGKEKSFNQLSPTTMTKVGTRAGDTVITDTATAKRWLRPYPYEKADLLDQWDSEYLGDIILPTSELMQNHAMAYGRACDEIIVDAALGDASTGESGTTVTPFDSNMSIAVGYVPTGSPANSGLTVAKLIQAKYLFDLNNVPERDPKFVAVSAKQLQDLLNQDKISSIDYNTVRALVAGEINTFLGFTFVRIDTDFFPYDAGTDIRTICAWSKSGIKMSDSGKQSFMDVRADKSHAIQLRTVASIGATRTQEKKVVRIYCDESPA